MNVDHFPDFQNVPSPSYIVSVHYMRFFQNIFREYRSLFIHINNFLRTSTVPIQTSASYYWYFYILIFSNNSVSTFPKVMFILNYLIIILNYLTLLVAIISCREITQPLWIINKSIKFELCHMKLATKRLTRDQIMKLVSEN